MQTRYLYLLRFILATTDIILINVILWLSFYFSKQNELNNFQHYTAIYNIIWLFSTSMFGLYTEDTIQRSDFIYRATWKSIVLYFLLIVFYINFSKDIIFPRNLLIYYFVLLSIIFVFSRFIGTGIEIILKRHFKIRRPVAIIGNNETGLRLAHYFQTHSNFDFDGFIGEPDVDYTDYTGTVSSGIIKNLTAASEKGIEEVYVCISPASILKMGSLIKEAENQHLRIKLVPDIVNSFPYDYNASYLNNFQILTPRQLPLDEVKHMFKKKLFDIIFSFLVIVFVFSWLFPIIILIIKATSRGPIFFVQDRVGRKNKIFKCLKFRTMIVVDKDTSNGYQPIGKGDKRITKFGTFLRKTSMDELPQFINVLRGEMSVVGPRPHAIAFNEAYSSIVEEIKIRHFVKPGITGWAQVHGLRGDVENAAENEIRTKNRINHDIWYIENWSLQLDVKIIFLTIWNIIKGQENAI
ncbi:MAG: exopolysaccharide biosynthesis polyprenyl glycosylphosphotransferase [Sphingobacteriaceae bacterium]|nr:MAG: exopolysaccharide biosynthesis polyprenyl glycosylphosphotransferase [Sphingobacteriaceae bacterium]